jgi:BirA family biotin operon repressor/biotin-[acetyl-CoA-carboxylase] ligase
MPADFQIWTLPTKLLGQRVQVYDCLDSTNSLALSLSDYPANHGLVILAREQSAGRGQHGRRWQAPPGSSVLMSVLLFPPRAFQRVPLLTAWAAVAVCETTELLTDLTATIKWPNDVLVHGKKVCGILIEQRRTGSTDHPLAVVVGIGLNVNQTLGVFAQAGLPDAASLASLSGSKFDCDAVAKALIRHLDEQYARLSDGDCTTLERNWKSRLGLVGCDVAVETLQETREGRLVDVTLAGIDLEICPRRPIRIPPEWIRRIRPISD